MGSPPAAALALAGEVGGRERPRLVAALHEAAAAIARAMTVKENGG